MSFWTGLLAVTGVLALAAALTYGADFYEWFERRKMGTAAKSDGPPERYGTDDEIEAAKKNDQKEDDDK